MEPTAQQPHQYHDTTVKTSRHHFIDWALLIGLFALYFYLYNFGKFTMREMIKTSGLLAISLLSITLVVGPLSRFIPSFNALKIHRKFWGIAAFLVAVAHGVLVFLFDKIKPEDFLGIGIGLLATFILLLVTASSDDRIIHRLAPGVWKKLQTASYLALAVAVTHFYVMEQKGGVLVIKRLLGQMTFWFATIVILIRLIVYFFPKKVTPTKTS